MIQIIKNADLYSPEYQGNKDILIANGKIEKIDGSISLLGVSHETFDAEGRVVVPGFIDKHVHVTGGGGEFGFSSYALEITADELLRQGTTTVVGLLGTDGVLKELTTLYAKIKALDSKMTAWMLSGSYSLPSKTLTGSVERDIILVDKVIGCKLALSEDRASFPTELEIKRLLTQIWRGGMVTGKGGVLHIHMGVLDSHIDPILNIARDNPRLIPRISLTHCARKEELFRECIKFAKMGGTLDITTGGSRFTDPWRALAIAIEAGVPLDRLTFSTDGRGGIRHIDPVTGEETYGTGPVDGNIKELREVVTRGILSPEDALKLVTSNPAKELNFKTKGHIAPGYDADIVLMDSDFKISKVMTRGVWQI